MCICPNRPGMNGYNNSTNIMHSGFRGLENPFLAEYWLKNEHPRQLQSIVSVRPEITVSMVLRYDSCGVCSICVKRWVRRSARSSRFPCIHRVYVECNESLAGFAGLPAVANLLIAVVGSVCVLLAKSRYASRAFETDGFGDFDFDFESLATHLLAYESRNAVERSVTLSVGLSVCNDPLSAVGSGKLFSGKLSEFLLLTRGIVSLDLVSKLVNVFVLFKCMSSCNKKPIRIYFNR